MSNKRRGARSIISGSCYIMCVVTCLYSRSCLAVKVDVETVHVTQQNGVGVTFSADVNELKLLLRNQVSRLVSLVWRMVHVGTFLVTGCCLVGLLVGWSIIGQSTINF